jgi:hypothetical protein
MYQMKKILSVTPLQLGRVAPLQKDIAAAITEGDAMALAKLVDDNPSEALEQVTIHGQHFSAVLLCDAYGYHFDNKRISRKHFIPFDAASILERLYKKLSVDFLFQLKAPNSSDESLVDSLFAVGDPPCSGWRFSHITCILDRLESRYLTFPGLFQHLSECGFYDHIAYLISHFRPDFDEVMIRKCLDMCLHYKDVPIEDITAILRKIGPERLCRRDESGNTILMRAVLNDAKYFALELCSVLSLDQILWRNNAGQTVFDIAKTEAMRSALGQQVREKESGS